MGRLGRSGGVPGAGACRGGARTRGATRPASGRRRRFRHAATRSAAPAGAARGSAAGAAARRRAARRIPRAAGAATRARALPARQPRPVVCGADCRPPAASAARLSRDDALAPTGAAAPRRCSSRRLDGGRRAARARRERGQFGDGGGDVALVGARPVAPLAAADARRRGDAAAAARRRGLCLPSHWQRARRAVGHPRAAGFARLRRSGPPRVRAFRDSGGGRRAGGARHPAGSLARGAGAALVCRG